MARSASPFEFGGVVEEPLAAPGDGCFDFGDAVDGLFGVVEPSTAPLELAGGAGSLVVEAVKVALVGFELVLRDLNGYSVEAVEPTAPAREDKPINRSHFDPYIWHRALKAVGVKPSRQNGMHALRHFYASVLIDAGESVKAVAEYLGHAEPGFTLRVYAHLFPSSEEPARAALDRVFGGILDVPATARVP